jgi:hypothetical protein
MRVWLDDERPAPNGWAWIKGYYAAMDLIIRGSVEAISLDHDLGLTGPTNETGGHILSLIEQLYIEDGVVPPQIYIHTQNPVARQWMVPLALKLNDIRRKAEANEPSSENQNEGQKEP